MKKSLMRVEGSNYEPFFDELYQKAKMNEYVMRNTVYTLANDYKVDIYEFIQDCCFDETTRKALVKCGNKVLEFNFKYRKSIYESPELNAVFACKQGE